MMLSALGLLFLLPASAVMGVSTPPPGNNTFVLGKRQTFTNVMMTWYSNDLAPVRSTTVALREFHQDSDFVVAMDRPLYEEGGCCGKQLVISVNGKSATATCVDECISCPYGALDLTKGLFEYFAGDLGVGLVFGSWSYA
ncbi:Expansin family [Mycena sanguinolenta]|uniref:Expansin family n=1 Tax=Mycena sanguinolenta TaxID=230812 RepID=A0A8H7CVA7_9AGAR|nr:Expansin family [Mycena sanguinolenta]